MISLISLTAVFISLAICGKPSRNDRLCQACISLNDVIEAGLKATKHKEGTVEQVGGVDSKGNRMGKTVPYANSEKRLMEILTADACKNNPNKLECYELIEESKYYDRIKEWFVTGRKNSFLQAICFSLIPNCSAKVLEKESVSSSIGQTMQGSTAALDKPRSLINKMIGFLPQSIQAKPFIKDISTKFSNLSLGKYSQLAKKYSSLAYSKSTLVTRKFNKHLDKLPIRKLIATLPLPIKTATFVEKHWKLIVSTLFLALLIPMYYLSLKVSGGRKGSERVRATRPVTRSSSRVTKKNE
jgi:hypothetical protein